MSLIVPMWQYMGFQYSNQTNGITTPGTSVTPGGSNAEGSWTQIATGSNIAQEVDYVVIEVSSGASSNNIKEHYLDIGYDPAGGTSYTAILVDINCGASTIGTNGGRWFHFPLYIPAGASVAARVRGSNATNGTVRVFVNFYGKPSRPEFWRRAGTYENVGIGASLGTSFTPGNASWGSWASLGTTTKNNWWFQTGVGINNSSMNAEGTRVQMAVGNGSSFDVINDFIIVTTTTEQIFSPLQEMGVKDVPSGSTLYVRGNCSGAPASGYHAVAHCMGE